MTDRELLIEIKTKLDELEKQFSNHLSTHAKYTYLAFTSLIGVLITLLFVLTKIQ